MASEYTYKSPAEDPWLLRKVSTWLLYREEQAPVFILETQYNSWRDLKLQETDWMFGSDHTPSTAWVSYRQALRDLPSTTDWPLGLQLDSGFVPLDPNGN